MSWGLARICLAATLTGCVAAARPAPSPAPASLVLVAPAATSPPVPAPTPLVPHPPWVTTFAGGGPPGLVDGAGTAARFRMPADLAVGPGGRLYVLDQVRGAIRRIEPSGQVSTVTVREAGRESTTQIQATGGIAADGAGNVYFVETRDWPLLRRIAPDGTLTTVTEIVGYTYITNFTSGGNGMAPGPDGGFFLTSREKVWFVSATGSALIMAGSQEYGFQEGTAGSARFFYPSGIVADASGGVIVADWANHRIRRVSAGRVTGRLAGRYQGYWDGPADSAEFDFPSGLALASDGNLYVADSGNLLIRRIAPDGTVSTVAGGQGLEGLVDGPGTDARFAEPHGLAFGADGRLYVSDTKNHAIRAIALR